MNFEQFKTDALRTESRPEKLNFSKVGLGMLLLLGQQTARVMDTAKKTMFYGKPLDAEAFRSQLGQLITTTQLLGMGAESVADVGLDELGNSERLQAPNLRLLHGAVGMFGEAGELLEALSKSMIAGKELDMTNFAEEVGDSDWYKAIIHDETGVSEEDCRAKVVAKLKARYGDKFTSEAALNRDLTTERTALETTTA